MPYTWTAYKRHIIHLCFSEFGLGHNDVALVYDQVFNNQADRLEAYRLRDEWTQRRNQTRARQWRDVVDKPATAYTAGEQADRQQARQAIRTAAAAVGVALPAAQPTMPAATASSAAPSGSSSYQPPPTAPTAAAAAGSNASASATTAPASNTSTGNTPVVHFVRDLLRKPVTGIYVFEHHPLHRNGNMPTQQQRLNAVVSVREREVVACIPEHCAVCVDLIGKQKISGGVGAVEWRGADGSRAYTGVLDYLWCRVNGELKKVDMDYRGMVCLPGGSG